MSVAERYTLCRGVRTVEHPTTCVWRVKGGVPTLRDFGDRFAPQPPAYQRYTALLVLLPVSLAAFCMMGLLASFAKRPPVVDGRQELYSRILL